MGKELHILCFSSCGIFLFPILDFAGLCLECFYPDGGGGGEQQQKCPAWCFGKAGKIV